MSSKFKIVIVLGLLGTAACAQQAGPSRELGVTNTTQAGEVQRSNLVSFGISASTTFDDNATNGATSQSNLTSSFQPQIGYRMSRPHVDSTFTYAPGYTYSRNISQYSNVSQAAGAELKYRFTKRLSMHLRDSFSLTTNPFDRINSNATLPGISVLDQPNGSVAGANVRSVTQQAAADATYAVSQRTSLSFGAAFSDLKYRAITSPAQSFGQSQNSRSWMGHVAYSGQIAAKSSVGMEYDVRNLNSLGGALSTMTHSTLAYYNRLVTPAVQLSLFGGPEYSTSDGFIPGQPAAGLINFSQMSFAGGATLSWQGVRNGANFKFIQQVSDAGAQGGGAVRIRSLDADLSRHLSKSLVANLHANYIKNDQLFGVFAPADYASGSFGLTKQLNPNLSFGISYLRQQFLGNVPGQLVAHNHDAATFSINYHFDRPIGR